MLLQVLWREFVTTSAMRESSVEVLGITDRIMTVFTSGAPHQVFDPVVGGVIVKVPRLHAVWAGADECFKDEAVHRSINAAIQHHMEMAAGARNPPWTQEPSCAFLHVGTARPVHRDHAIQRPNMALVTDFISPLKTKDGSPLHRHDDIPNGVT